MKAAKIFNMINGVFYGLYGLYGALLPVKFSEIMGWTPSLLGLHQIRAVSLVMAVLGVLAFVYARRHADQRPLLLVFIIVTLGFAAGRILGLATDGIGPSQTYFEIAFEITWAFIAYIIYGRIKDDKVA